MGRVCAFSRMHSIAVSEYGERGRAAAPAACGLRRAPGAIGDSHAGCHVLGLRLRSWQACGRGSVRRGRSAGRLVLRAGCYWVERTVGCARHTPL